ncbi:MAG: hypothetical protein KF851_02745 [Pirellulaceae bacterium]|nr:hypothetical protein [Pirellulaceae bacterium]
MTNREFESYVALLNGFLRMRRSESNEIVNELRDHLESRVADLVANGYATEEAEKLALEEFGDAMAMANQFKTVFFLKRKRWTMKMALGLVVAGTLGIWGGWNLWPQPEGGGNHGAVIAQDSAQGQDEIEQGETAQTDDKANPFDRLPGQTDESRVARTRPSSEPSEKTRLSLQTRRALKELVHDKQYEQEPFSLLLANLQVELPGIRFYIDQSAIDDSLSEDTEITFDFGKDSLFEELNLALRSHNATFAFERRTVKIISLDAAHNLEFFRRELIDCRRLLKLIAETDRRFINFSSPPGAIPVQGMKLPGSVVGNVDMGNAGMFRLSRPFERQSQKGGNEVAGELGEQALREDDQAEDNGNAPSIPKLLIPEFSLITAITNSIRPNEWDFANGEATISFVGGIMILTASETMIDEVKDFVADLTSMLKAEE